MSCDKNVFSMDVFLGLSRFATRDAGDLCRDNAPSTANSSSPPEVNRQPRFEEMPISVGF
jgi:hypothetical protein